MGSLHLPFHGEAEGTSDVPHCLWNLYDADDIGMMSMEEKVRVLGLCVRVSDSVIGDLFPSPNAVDTVLQLIIDAPTQIEEPIPLLTAENTRLCSVEPLSVIRSERRTLSRLEVATLLACMLMWQVPDEIITSNETNWNFNAPCHMGNLWKAAAGGDVVSEHKLRCILSYFDSPVTLHWSEEFIHFSRWRRSFSEEWKDLQNDLPINLPPLHIVDGLQGFALTPATEAIADFANEYIGGGVLGRGAVQEEILFVTHPEALVSLCLCDQMERDEAILISGIKRSCDSNGYASTFRWERSLPLQQMPGRLFFCFDALYFRSGKVHQQFRKSCMLREINKAIVAFTGLLTPREENSWPSALNTGHWGGGAFHGHRPLKCLLQWIAFAIVWHEQEQEQRQRQEKAREKEKEKEQCVAFLPPVAFIFHTFGDVAFSQRLRAITTQLMETPSLNTVEFLLSCVATFYPMIKANPEADLWSHIEQCIQTHRREQSPLVVPAPITTSVANSAERPVDRASSLPKRPTLITDYFPIIPK